MEVCKKTKSNTLWSLVFFKFLAVTFLILLLRVTSYAQADTALKNTDYDSVKKDYDSATTRLYNNIRRFGVEEQKKNALEYSEDTIGTKQEELIKQVRGLMLEAQKSLETGLDTAGLNSEINKIQYWYEITSDGVFTK